MEKINIAELLKDCPTGMELDCPLFDNVYFNEINNCSDFPIICYTLCDERKVSLIFTKFGEFNTLSSAKCVIFPKGKTTWEGFIPPCKFKDGDIVATTSGTWIGITEGGEKHSFIPTYCVLKSNGAFESYFDIKATWGFDRLATEEEKEKLFQAIKDSGYKWNAETKTLEKLIEPKFKVGDRIAHKNGITKPFTISQVGGGYYYANDKNAVGIMSIEDQDNYELVPNKFDVSTLIPFESKVLVRDSDIGIWLPEFFGCLCDGNDCPYMTVGGTRWKCCIPFKGNEHLLAKCDDCIDFYKNWE